MDDPVLLRIAVLGPVVRYAAPTAAKADDDQHDPHCPCCLLAKNFEAFQALLQGTEPFGVRLLSMRNDDNSVAADCRVNGNDFPAGMEALRAYAEGWPGEGMDMRKQYVVMYTGTDP